MEATWEKSQRGGRILIDNQQFRYNKLKESVDKQRIVFRCVKYNTLNCKALAYLDVEKNIITKTTQHTDHSTELRKHQVKQVVKEYINHASNNSMVPPRRVYADVLHALESSNAPDTADFLPGMNTFNSQLRRVRIDATGQPCIPHSYEELAELPEDFKKTANGNPFLVFNDWVSEDDPTKKAMVFLTDNGKNMLTNSKEWYLDGTFSTAPELFSQVFVITCKLETGDVLPAAYMLLPDKETSTYRKAIFL